MLQAVRNSLSLILLLMLLGEACFAGVIERRKDQYGHDFAYYIFPIAGEIPGMGSASGLGVNMSNMADSDSDFTGYYVTGDIQAKGATLLDYHLLSQRLIFDIGYNNYKISTTSYNSQNISDPVNVIHPKVEGNYMLGQLTLTFDERRYEMFLRALRGRNRTIEVLDKDYHAFAGVDTGWKNGIYYTVGGSLDLTDDRLDPRRGARFEFASRLPTSRSSGESEYYVYDYNFTGLVPMHRWDTLVFNLFYSRARVTRQGITDYATLQQYYGLDCNQYPAGTERSNCLAAEANLLAGMIADNRYGTATALGGTQRLRSYDNGRFSAAQALFYGVEYRWNLTDERTPFNIYLAKGIRTGIQLAAFWEKGMVANESSQLYNNPRESYGIGLRVILSGVVIRFDLARGSEGTQSQLFITYPWSMFSVDNPG